MNAEEVWRIGSKVGSVKVTSWGQLPSIKPVTRIWGLVSR